MKTNPLRVFIAYRQGDQEGTPCAIQLAESLRRRQIAIDGALRDIDVYLDAHAPALSDWREKWRAHLKASRAFVLVCTPGACHRRQGQDWLYEEMDWWLRHRRTAPLLIDAADAGEQVVPKHIRKKWPYAQRLPWRAAAGADVDTVDRLLAGILISQQGVKYEELRRLWTRNALIVLLAILGIGLGLYLQRARRETAAEQARAYASSVQLALTARESLDIRTARARLDETPPKLRKWEWSHVNFLVDQSRLTINVPFSTTSDSVNDLAISPNGRHVAVAADDGRIYIYDLETGRYAREPLCCHRPAEYFRNGDQVTECLTSIRFAA